MNGVFVVGAGPAGIFAAGKVALAGFEVFLFNRDIKPGGLAEYGIYPRKEKMKAGLRKQFAQVLDLPNVHYFGHVHVGSAYDVPIEELESLRPAAIVFACGAQGARQLGLPGEDAKGVYAAKDFVYHYNRLPPYASMDFSAGKRIAIVGMGNVAIDIARWLLEDDPDRVAENVLVVARRGPLEIKFDEKELDFIERHMARDELGRELERVRDRCARCGQDVSPQRIFEHHFLHLKDADFASIPPRLSFRFLSSPEAILPDANGRIARLVVLENDLVRKDDGSTAAIPTWERAEIEADTLIFAIGDRHDPRIGLPIGPDGFATAPRPDQPAEPSFELWDQNARCALPGRYVAGWARHASAGLAGIARHDGEVCAQKVIDFVRDAPDSATAGERRILASLEARGLRVVTAADLVLLARAEAREALARQLASFTFADNEAMFRAIDEERERLCASRAEEHLLQPAP
jgi:ferredoxin--NADP+ reductase